MPTYSYACTACEHRFDAVQAFTDSSLTECPACSGRLRKLFSSVGIVFKGSGFYRNDSRSAPVSAESNGDSKSDTKTDAKSDTKSDSKSKSDTKSSSEKTASSASSSNGSSGSSTSAAASS